MRTKDNTTKKLQGKWGGSGKSNQPAQRDMLNYVNKRLPLLPHDDLKIVLRMVAGLLRRDDDYA